MDQNSNNKIDELLAIMDEVRAKLDHVESVLLPTMESDYDPAMADAEDTMMDPMHDDTADDSDAELFHPADPVPPMHTETMPEMPTDMPLFDDTVTEEPTPANDDMHTHEDGTTHEHEGGDVPHTHDEPMPAVAPDPNMPAPMPDEVAMPQTEAEEIADQTMYDSLPSDTEPTKESE
tara:strand:+ start:40 stop:570 length:531 start_codon:yes stop_codon:yes gene_type:complete